MKAAFPMKIRRPSGRLNFALFWIFALTALVFEAQPALAFCPVPDPPRVCSEFFQASAVFAGTVISVSARSDTDGFIAGWTYLLKVKKDYRGQKTPFVKVFTANDSGRLPLTKGSTYILFPSLNDGTLQIYGCGNSVNVSQAKAQGVIRQLDNVIAHMNEDTGGDIGGQITTEPVQNLRGITMIATSDGRTYRAATNDDGIFHIHIPAGLYTVKSESNKWVVSPFDISWERPDHVEIHNGGCADLALHAFRSN
jgi:hypothetical protein